MLRATNYHCTHNCLFILVIVWILVGLSGKGRGGVPPFSVPFFPLTFWPKNSVDGFPYKIQCLFAWGMAKHQSSRIYPSMSKGLKAHSIFLLAPSFLLNFSPSVPSPLIFFGSSHWHPGGAAQGRPSSHSLSAQQSPAVSSAQRRSTCSDSQTLLSLGI